ncbi:MAG: AAA family ATPase, partial [Planctomycetaceae bacterium]
MTERGSENQTSHRLNTVPAIPDSPQRIFVSFRRTSPLVERLLTTLRDDPEVVLDPIFDIFQGLDRRGLLDTWSLESQRALSRAAVLLLLIDDDWVRYADEFGRRRIDDPADTVHQEIGFALSRNIPIVPVLLGHSRMPPAKALPPPLARLTQFQGVVLRDDEDFHSDYHRLRNLLLARMPKTPPASVPSRESPPLLRVNSLELRDFRCFANLHVELCQPSKLPGHWSCVAGLNGAGKSSLLQALALLLMGPEYSRELGGSRLASMRRRRPDGSTADAYLKARVEHLGQEVTLEMSIDSRGGLAWGGDNLWSSITESLILGFGATRNLSDTPDRYGELSPPARACISLFDSLARLEDGERLLRNSATAAEGAGNSAAAAKLLTQILKRLLPGEIRAAWTSQHGFQFRSPSRSDDPSVTAYDLPDGFRSTIAWI